MHYKLFAVFFAGRNLKHICTSFGWKKTAESFFLNNIFHYGTQLVHSFSLIKQIVLQRNHKSDLGAHHNSPRRLLSKQALVHSVIVMPVKTNVAARKATVPNKSKNSVDINTSRKEMELIKAPVTFFWILGCIFCAMLPSAGKRTNWFKRNKGNVWLAYFYS